MGLKKLNDIKKKEDDFIQGAKTESHKKGKVDKAFTKQTINLDEKRYIKANTHCKRNKISFQDFMVKLIDDFFN